MASPACTALPLKARETLEAMGQADILFGIPSFNNAATIGHVIRAVKVGWAKYYPGRRAVLVNSDGGSTDGTQDVVKRTLEEDSYDMSLVHTPSLPLRGLTIRYEGIPGKGSAFKAVFEAARLLNVKACAVFDSDLRSITPEWVQLLLAPVLEKGYGYVCPFYRRHKYDGTITNSIAYPLTRALYGRRVRQPIGGDFGFSGDLVSRYLEKDVWETDVARFGIDIWMTTTAMVEGFKICQSFMGAKIHDAKDPGADLGPMFEQVVGTIFSLMKTYEARWREVAGSRPTAIFGFQAEVSPGPLHVNVHRMIEKFKEGFDKNQAYYEGFLASDCYTKLAEVREMCSESIDFPKVLWVKTIYNYAARYHDAGDKKRLLDSLIPLYFGYVASFVRETETYDDYRAEDVIEELCEIYEDTKPYLLQLWTERVSEE